jgi:hypothetical protein
MNKIKPSSALINPYLESLRSDLIQQLEILVYSITKERENNGKNLNALLTEHKNVVDIITAIDNGTLLQSIKNHMLLNIKN